MAVVVVVAALLDDDDDDDDDDADNADAEDDDDDDDRHHHDHDVAEAGNHSDGGCGSIVGQHKGATRKTVLQSRLMISCTGMPLDLSLRITGLGRTGFALVPAGDNP